MRLRSKQDIKKIKDIFITHYKEAKTELNYTTLYELVVAVVLSAQCTDKRVNIITKEFFRRFPDIHSLAKADVKEVKEVIKSCSFPNNKAKNLVNMAKIVVNEYKGEFPKNEKDLKKLPGIGQKSANVVMIEFHNKNLMAVDTHVFRVAKRLRLSNANSPEKTEEELTKTFKTNLNILHQAMVLFGRYICKAKKPECNRCFLYDLCDYEKKE